MEFEYDPREGAINRDKHGIDFVRAQELWQDSARIEVAARSTDEPRWLIVGRIGEQHWSAVVTYRGERVWLISVHRSCTEEKMLYEGA